MESAREKFQQLLRELFQFDSSDLDFGIYRIMNYKRDVIDKFIREDLPKTIESELDRGQLADQTYNAKELATVKEHILENFGRNAIDTDGKLADAFHETPLGKTYIELQEKAAGSRAREGLETIIFNHLYTFFSRYYQDGDFISKRRYSKKQKYAIPYNGEEVYLHWANNDQYYVKTGEHFHDYTFTSHGIKVHFKIKEADVEQNNVKGDSRFFLPRVKEIDWYKDSEELVIPFEYRPLNEQEKVTYSSKQETIITEALEAIPKNIKKSDKAIAALSAERRKNAEGKSVSYLEHHLRQYTRRNTSDFFIHKNLQGFLSQELDFYLKNEVLNLDEIEAAGENRSEGWFQIMRVIKTVGSRIIDFLDQIESFQKMLWEKRKFVTETQYCITVGNIDESFYPEIAECEAQWDEWKELFHIGDKEDEMFSFNLEIKEERINFLKEHPSLPIDTVHYTSEIKDSILESFTNLEDSKDGLIFHGENWQALNLSYLQIANRVSNIFIDPPYNTGDDGFIYKDSYPSSTWLSMVNERINLGIKTLSDSGAFFISIGDEEQDHLSTMLRHRYGKDRLFANLVWEKKKKGSFLSGFIARMKDYILCISKEPHSFDGLIGEISTDTETYPCVNASNPREVRKIPPGIISKYREKNYTLKAGEIITAGNMNLVLKSDLVIKNGKLSKELTIEGNWRYSQESMSTYAEKKELYITQDLYLRRIVKEPRYKRMKDLLHRIGTEGEYDFRDYDINNLSKYGWGTNEDANDELHQILGTQYAVPYPKPSKLITLLFASSRHTKGYWLDYFAGSGTSGQAVLNINRRDGNKRKFILMEMGEYFNTVLLPRIKKVTFTPEWKEGKPKRMPTQEEVERSPRIIKYHRLESYEDALNNIQFDEESGQGALGFDDYLLKYMLNWETKNSETLLNIEKLANPFDYKLRVVEGEKTTEKTVDIPETFNYLLGLHVKTRKVYDNNRQKYLVFRGQIDHREVAVIWRNIEDWTKEDLEQDKKFVMEQQLTEGADEVFVNGDSFIPEAKSLDPIFKARMFAEVQ